MRWLLLAIAAVLLPGCDRLTERGAASPKLADARYRATLENRGIGRFEIIPASGDYPPLFLDSVTGCVEQIRVNATDGLIQKLPIATSDSACLGNMPRDRERERMEVLNRK
jgi:hypothetical protein